MMQNGVFQILGLVNEPRGSIVFSDLDNNGVVDLVVATDTGQIHAFDIYGNVVRQIDHINKGKIVFYKEGLSKGVYLVELSSRSRLLKGRLVINQLI